MDPVSRHYRRRMCCHHSWFFLPQSSVKGPVEAVHAAEGGRGNKPTSPVHTLHVEHMQVHVNTCQSWRSGSLPCGRKPQKGRELRRKSVNLLKSFEGAAELQPRLSRGHRRDTKSERKSMVAESVLQRYGKVKPAACNSNNNAHRLT